MALPLLPEDKIVAVFSILEQENFNLREVENELIKKLKFYYKKTWIVGEKVLSIFSAENSTNNGAVPCGHANLCGNCGHKFINEDMHCPICRSEILRLMQIFQ